MTDPTKYVCRCGRALRFWYAMSDKETPCWCYCPDCMTQADEPAKGKDAKSAFEDWQRRNGFTAAACTKSLNPA